MKRFLICILCLLLCSCSFESYGFNDDYGYEYEYQNSDEDYIYSEDNNDTTTNTVLSDTLTVHYIDVGQGDSTFIELGNGQTLLIDAGESGNSDTIINYISNLGYTKIDYVVGTHPHTDHIGALASIIDYFDIGIIYMPNVTASSKTYENLLTTIKNNGYTVTTGKAGVSIIDSDNLQVYMIAPNSSSYSGYNNYSIVIKLIYGSTSFLFMGDAEELSESEITADVSADVLKVGHHGSDTSSSDEFLSRVSPKYAVISVGANNSYGHPSTEVLNRLKNYTTNIYRTDEDGTIVISSDGINIVVEE